MSAASNGLRYWLCFAVRHEHSCFSHPSHFFVSWEVIARYFSQKYFSRYCTALIYCLKIYLIIVCSTSWSIIHCLFNSLLSLCPFLFLSAAPFHILYYAVTYRSHAWLLFLDDCCWTSGLFIGELSYSRTGRLMLEI